MRSALHVVVSNTGWLMLDRLTRMLLGVMVGAWIARHLGPESFGALAYVLALLALFQAATSLGLDLILARDLAKHDSESHLLLGSSLRLRFGAGVMGWFGACAAVMILRPSDHEALMLTMLAGAVLLFQPSDLIDLWFQSQSQSRRAVVPRTGSFLLVSGLRVALILTDSPLWAFALAYVTEGLLAALFLWYSYKRHPTVQPWQWDMSTARSLLRSGWPLLVSSLSIIIYMRIDLFFLRSLTNDRELGLYAAILPFSQAWHFIPAAICASITPHLVQLHSSDPARFDKTIGDLFALMFWCSLIISVVIALAARPIVDLLLGHEFQDSSHVLALHVFSTIPVFLGLVQTRYLSILGRTRTILLQTMCGMVFSIALNLVLIPQYGAIGAAASSILAQCVSAVFCNAVFEPKLFRMQMTSWRRRSHAKDS